MDNNKPLQILSENVKVYCRQRGVVQRAADVEAGAAGISDGANSASSETAVNKDQSYISEIVRGGSCKYYSPNLKTSQVFEFNDCFDMACNQNEVFEVTSKPLIDSVIEGYSATILAYGKTGSGKTFTMRGGHQDETKGIIPRCIESLLSASSINNFEIWVSYFQIYCEEISDLLVISQNSLAIKDNGERAYVDGLSRSRVTSLNDINALLDRGDSVRATASTNANDTSSRSHAILTITLRKNNDVNSASTLSNNNNNNNITESNLVLVDLAGSERYNDISGSAYTRRAESRSINLSLSSLGNCIHALSEGKSHIPFRDSKLTRLLRASLGGGSRLSIIVTVPPGPDSNGDILNSLRFAARAAKVKVEAKVSRFVDYESLYREAQLQIDVFNSQENKQASEIRDLIMKIEAQDREILELKSQNNLLTAQNNAYQQNESKGGSSKTASSNESAVEEIATTINTLKGKYENDLNELKRRYDKKIIGLNKTISELERDNNEAQSLVNLERTGHLNTLKELRGFQEKLMTLETESQSRIQELVMELQDQRAANDEMTEKTTSLVDYYKNEMATMVPKVKVEEMEHLFMDTIDKLSMRVVQIEKKKVHFEKIDETDDQMDVSHQEDSYAINRLGSKPAGIPLPPAHAANQRTTRMEPGGKIRVNTSEHQSNNNIIGNNINFPRSLSDGNVKFRGQNDKPAANLSSADALKSRKY